MATVDSTKVEQWLEFGGTVEEQKTRTGRKSAKIFVAPSGAVPAESARPSQ